ncbi:MAG: DUF2075 domain-containing protein [Myxococcota bacterium]
MDAALAIEAIDSMTSPASSFLSNRAWYEASISEFLGASGDSIIGRMSRTNPLPTDPEQVEAWEVQIELLKEWLKDIAGSIYIEFAIPRMGRRVDTILLMSGLVLVIEFKVGATTFDRSGFDQVWDYALDLKNFHESSHDLPIVPILVATAASESESTEIDFADDLVSRPLRIAPNQFRSLLAALPLKQGARAGINVRTWATAPYRPTPTIIEAARSLYANHSVESIARHDAGAKNLRHTSTRIEQIIDEARQRQKKVICFVTGVPGAGKTLVGLNVATQRRDSSETHAVFLSGNGPLVEVLRAALTRDDKERRLRLAAPRGAHKAANPVKAFIQNVHHFRDEALTHPAPPANRVVIFDEAQRAWDLRKTAEFMKRRKGRAQFTDSEPAFLLRYMDRHDDWAVVICLVGGGQEIHTGEAGIGEWIDAANRLFPDWHLYISSDLTDSEYAAGAAIDLVSKRRNVTFEDKLHLAVSMRSFRADHVSTFVKSMLDGRLDAARIAFSRLDRFPIVITRDLGRARAWIRDKARGSERSGLVASSKAMRLKPHAIDIRVSVNPVHWFLKERSDIRASDYLEDCATEFQVQGLELDWTCVNWDGDLRYNGKEWTYFDFRGSRWENIRSAERQNYLRNAYRVLLTRARQGMVLFIPPGSEQDSTRSHQFYDPTFQYLREIGIPELT